MTDASRPLVSVVIPAFNASRTIVETLESACAQTWRELEIVVVDDGSTDDTVALVSNIAGRDDRVRLLSKPNGGASAARNHGIRAARGTFIAPLDSDDLWHPTKIERQMHRFSECGPDVGVVYTRTALIDANSRVVSLRPGSPIEGRVFTRLLVWNCVGNGSAILVRRAAFEDIGGYDETLRNTEDWNVQVLLAWKWRFAAVDEALTGYRKLPNTKSGNNLRMKLAHLDAVRRIAARYPEAPAAAVRSGEGLALTLLAVVRLRSGEPITAARDIWRALRRAPLASLDMLLRVETGRLLRKAALWIKLLPSKETQAERLPFVASDPNRPYDRRRPLAWLIDRMERLEDEGVE